MKISNSISNTPVVNNSCNVKDYNGKLKFNNHILDVSILSDNPIIIDAGACQNIDIPVDVLKNYTIYTIEPEIDNIKILEEKISERTDKDNIHLIKKALVGNNFEDQVTLYTFGSEKPGWTSIFETACANDPMKEYNKSYKVDTITISELCDMFEHIDYLKMDIEGAEYDIFKTISNKDLNKIQQISLEYHKEKQGVEIVDILTSSDFKIIDWNKDIHEIYAVSN
jgi:FkbM family methyltransferase